MTTEPSRRVTLADRAGAVRLPRLEIRLKAWVDRDNEPALRREPAPLIKALPVLDDFPSRDVDGSGYPESGAGFPPPPAAR